MKKWWCKHCFMPCTQCIEEDWPHLDPNRDINGEIKVKTVDFRKERKQSEEAFEEELAKADFPDFIDC